MTIALSEISYNCDVRTLYEIDLGEGHKISLCDFVYEPAEDSWLILELMKDSLNRQEETLATCIDVGTGTGIQGITCLLSMKVAYAVLTDVSPCALKCARLNIAKNRLEHQADLVQCNRLDCVRKGDVAVYNLPYLPVTDEWAGLEGLQWSGGREEAIAFIYDTTSKGFKIIGLTFSSLAGNDAELRQEFERKGYKLYATRRMHVFFEDIIAMVFQRKEENED
ncbi:MAG: 50S ribosomal protein L11 methyltransferase [Pyrodictiaceae archaeon]